ncbi:MAG: hypothetical protein WC149_10270, partial [Arcobacteraceae bacterium]
LIVRSLIVLTEGSKGISKFPSYCTVWITKDIEDDELLTKIIFDEEEKRFLFVQKHKKFIQTYKVKYEKFQYFQTLETILEKSRSHPKYPLDLNFFKSKQMSIYFDIFSKLYIGYILEDEFVKLVPSYNLKARESKIVVTIEKINTKLYDFVYYVKEKTGKLKRLYVAKEEVKLKDKELDGFTNAEIRFVFNILKENYVFSCDDLLQIKKIGFDFKY